jgi:hypothetical protein
MIIDDRLLDCNQGFDFDLNLTINSDMDTIVRAMAEPGSGLDIRDRVWLKIPIPRSFLGKKYFFFYACELFM